MQGHYVYMNASACTYVLLALESISEHSLIYAYVHTYTATDGLL